MPAHAVAVRNEPSPFERSRGKFEALAGRLASVETMSMAEPDIERFVVSEGREVLLQLLQDHLDLRGPGRAGEPVIGADGVRRTHERERPRKVETTLGGVTVSRMGYGLPGRDSLHPLDADLNLPPEVYSLEVRRCVCREVAQRSFDAACSTISTYTGAHVPKRQAEQLVVRGAADFDAFYEQRELEAPVGEAAANLLVLSFDGKGVRMRKEDLREPTRKRASKRQPKLQWRRSKGEKPGHKRMAEVAAVYTVAPFIRSPEDVIAELTRTVAANDRRPRPRPEGKRVWASLELDQNEVIRDVFAEAIRRDPQNQKTWVLLVDGEESQLMQAITAETELGRTVVIIVDLFHVAQYLWKAAYSFHREGSQDAQDWVYERLLRVLQGKAVHVAAGIRRSATLQGLSDAKREAADKAADYLLKYGPFLDYDQYLAQGFPISTGVIEGTCRHLVNDRMDLTGAIWGLTTAEAVLKLRALWASGDLEAYWRFHEESDHARNHLSRYNDLPPEPLRPIARMSSQRSKLRLVK